MSPDASDRIERNKRAYAHSPLGRLRKALYESRRAYAKAKRYDRQCFGKGRIDGLETAIRILREAKR